MERIHLSFARQLDQLCRFVSSVGQRSLAVWWRIRGAAIGKKNLIGSRLQLTRPWQFRTGTRCVIESDVSIKIVDDNARLILGDSCYVARFSQFDLSSECVVGDHVLIATGCLIVDHNHGLDRDRRIDDQPCVAKSVTIGSDVWIGAHAVILPGVTIGQGAVIGAHACVTSDIPPYSIAVGVPARVIGMRCSSSDAVQQPE